MKSKSELTYIGQLVDAAWNGAHSIGPSKPIATQSLCVSAAVGSALGALTAVLQKRRRAADLGVSAILGGAVGLCAGAAWQSRSTVGGAARSAMHRVGMARDLHWLEKNPIAYG
jgi:hypothetical protein